MGVEVCLPYNLNLKTLLDSNWEGNWVLKEESLSHPRKAGTAAFAGGRHVMV